MFWVLHGGLFPGILDARETGKGVEAYVWVCGRDYKIVPLSAGRRGVVFGCDGPGGGHHS